MICNIISNWSTLHDEAALVGAILNTRNFEIENFALGAIPAITDRCYAVVEVFLAVP